MVFPHINSNYALPNKTHSGGFNSKFGGQQKVEAVVKLKVMGVHSRLSSKDGGSRGGTRKTATRKMLEDLTGMEIQSGLDQLKQA